MSTIASNVDKIVQLLRGKVKLILQTLILSPSEHVTPLPQAKYRKSAMTNRVAIRPLAIIAVIELTIISMACSLTTVASQPSPKTIIEQTGKGWQITLFDVPRLCQ
jgi:hypothetical protein